jgi:hypothetical protein
MPAASRFRFAEDVDYVDVAAQGANERLVPQFPDEDHEAIAKELGAARHEVAFVIHGESQGKRAGYRLTGTFGPGEDYVPGAVPQVRAERAAKGRA